MSEVASGVSGVEFSYAVLNEWRVRSWLDKGHSPSYINAQGRPLLWEALRNEKFEAAKLLIDAGADFMAIDQGSQSSLAHVGLANNQVELVMKMHALCQNVGRMPDRQGNTLAHALLSSGNAKISETLVWLADNNYPIDQANNKNITPLMLAGGLYINTSMMIGAMNTLLDLEADPTRMNNDGETARQLFVGSVLGRRGVLSCDWVSPADLTLEDKLIEKEAAFVRRALLRDLNMDDKLDGACRKM